MADLAFKPGDVVKFVDVNNVGDCIPTFQTDNVAPSAEICHGATIVGKRYFEEFGKVTWAGGGYYVVEYSDENNVKVKLAFSKTKLQLVRTEGDKSKIDFTKLDRIVIEDKVRNEIVSVLKQHKNAAKLFEEWGLGEIMEYGRGMGFMFYGPPGTGKTGMANAIAAALATDLLIISAAEIQSSEPGGANRNIQQAFKAAKDGNKVLFLDECDSLITSRADLGMILASEVNTLLTEIEKFEGVCILATNRIENMDEALERRISLIVEFPHPNLEQRKAIWNKLIPVKMPLAKNVKVDELSKLKLTGGQIKNAILQAARLALSSEEKQVDKRHFDAAIERILNSKGLMGSASRYRQGIIDDLHQGVSSGKTRSSDVEMSVFLEKEAEKARKKEQDTN